MAKVGDYPVEGERRLESRRGRLKTGSTCSMKMFFIKGEEGLRVQVRTDWFDAFNHFNLGSPGATIGDTCDGGTPVATAGKIFGGSGSRIVQVAVRVIF